jgi:hypothetical protein
MWSLVDHSPVKESLEPREHFAPTISALLDYWEQAGRVDRDKITATRNFLKG